jgi:hypothetical protein
MEGSPEGTKMDARSRHCLLLSMVRGVYMDFDPREMFTRGIQWMVRPFTFDGARLLLNSDTRVTRCNAYNVASAGACLLGVVFGVNVFFDVKDLHQSRVSPRTRT